MKLSGQLSKEFFGGEIWVLRTREGAQYQLQGRIPEALEGKQVAVSASPSENAFGIGMVGEILDVSSIREA